MTHALIRQMAEMADQEAFSAFDRTIAEHPDERIELMRAFRAELPHPYFKWLDQTSGLKSRRR